SRPRLQYQLPNQNLNFSYIPGTLKPLALAVDTGGRWTNQNYVKVGVGTLKTPYLETGLSVGDGKTSGINAYARHTSSKGKIDYQKFKTTQLDVYGFLQTAKNLEWDGRIGGQQESYYHYGFKPKNLEFSPDSLKIKYNTWRGRISFHNINRTEFGLSYAPEIKVDVFSDGLSNSESNTYVHLPLQKWVGKTFGVEAAVTGDMTRYKPDRKSAISNNFFVLAPSLLFRNQNINIKGGIKPSWDNGDFRIFPNITAELSSSDKRITFQAGWVGYLRKNSFQYLAGFNPWIWAPGYSNNSSIDERFAGFKGSVGDHFTYSLKAGFHTIKNQPLFVNDTASGKSFMVVNEPQLKVVHFGGELGYTVGEKFSLISNLAFNQYTGLKVNSKAWGLLPLELKTAMRLQVLKDLYVKADLYGFDGGWYREKNKRGKTDSGMDLSAGLEFAIVKNIKVWAQFNNIFNKEYERWHQYPVYPFNLMGGVVFSFAQNNQ
ncbi:MAG: hypothetical protein ICV81_20680, partial [Flavisolibacter sp.]|nr:hypothetical protein [Flavisolibacter sp.]